MSIAKFTLCTTQIEVRTFRHPKTWESDLPTLTLPEHTHTGQIVFATHSTTLFFQTR